MERKRKVRQRSVGRRRSHASSTSQFRSGLPHRQIRRLLEGKSHLKLIRARQYFKPHRAFHIRENRRKPGNWQITTRNERNVTAESGIICASSSTLDSSPSYSSLDWDAVSTSSRNEIVSFVEPETGKTPQVGAKVKLTFEPDPFVMKYARLKPDLKDLSVSLFDGDDCCIVFENSVSPIQNSACSSEAVEKAVTKSVSSNEDSACSSNVVEHAVAKSDSLNPSTSCSSAIVKKGIAKSVSSNQSSACSSEAVWKAGVKSISLNPRSDCSSDIARKAIAKSVSSIQSTAPLSSIIEKTVAKSVSSNQSSASPSIVVEKAVAKSVSLNPSSTSSSNIVKKPVTKSAPSNQNSADSNIVKKSTGNRGSSFKSTTTSSVVEKAIAKSDLLNPSSACSSDTVKKPVAKSVSSILSTASSSNVVEKALAKSVSSIQSSESASDIVEKAVAKERKIIQDKNTTSNHISERPVMILTPLMLKLCQNFTARVDDTAVKKHVIKDEVETSDGVPQEKIGKQEEKLDLPDEETVDGVLEGIKENLDEDFGESSLSEAERCWDSDASSVQRELPDEKREKYRKLKDESTLEDDLKGVRRGLEINDLPSKKISLEEFNEKKLLHGKAALNDGVLTTTGTIPAENTELETAGSISKNPVAKDKETDNTNIGIGEVLVPVIPQDGTVDQPTVPVPDAEDTRPKMIDADTNTTVVKPRKRRCHCWMTKFKLRRFNRKLLNLKKLTLLRTRTFKADRDEFSDLLKNHNEILKSFLTVLRSQVSFNERVLDDHFHVASRLATTDTRSFSTQTERSCVPTPEKQSSSVQTELTCLTTPEKQLSSVQTEQSRFITKEKQSSSTQTEQPRLSAPKKQPSSARKEQSLLIATEKQCSGTHTEPGSFAIEVIALSEDEVVKSPEVPNPPPPEVSSTLNSATRRLFREEDKVQKRKLRKPLSLKESGKAAIFKGWDAIRQKAAALGLQKDLNSREESHETRDSSRKLFSESSDEPSDSSVSTDLSVANNVGSSAKMSSFEDEAKTVEELKAVFEELKADEEDVELPKKRKRRIRFQLDKGEIEASPPKRIEQQVESPSTQEDNKEIRSGRSVRSKPPSSVSLSSDDDVSWNLYIKDLVGRLSQEYSINESHTGSVKDSPRKSDATKIKLHNEDVLSFLFLDELYAFNTRKINPNFRRFPYDETALAKIISELRVSGDVKAAEKAVYKAGILNCSLTANEEIQLRQYLKTFAPSCFYFQVHLDIQTGVEALRIVTKEARCKDNVIDGLEGLKVSVKGVQGSLPKFVDNETEEEVGKSTFVIGPASFISQDSSPNVKFFSLDRHTVGLVAIRDILPGEELFVAAAFSCKKRKVNHPRKSKEKEKLERSF